MNAPRLLTARQRGMAVIGALLVVAVVAVITAGMFERQTIVLRGAENDQARAQARWLLAGGTDWAKVILHSDGRRYATTHGDQLWATPIADMQIDGAGPLSQALFSGRVEDEQGKLNVNALAVNGMVQPAALTALQRLLASLSLPASLAPRIAQRVAQGQYRVDEAGQAGGGPTRPALTSVDDLRGIEDLNDRTLAVLRSYLTVLPSQSAAINVNTAAAEVLAASVPGLSIGQARQLVLARERGQWFNDSADFINRLGDAAQDIGSTAFTANSEWFMVRGTVRLARADVQVQALLRRQPQQMPTTVWQRES